MLYTNGAPSPAVADRARSAAERALALDPQRPEGYRALGNYYRLVAATSARAVEQYTKGLKLAPDDADLLRGLGYAEQALGRWDQAVEHLRRSRSPGSPRRQHRPARWPSLLLWRRQYDEALATASRRSRSRPAVDLRRSRTGP